MPQLSLRRRRTYAHRAQDNEKRWHGGARRHPQSPIPKFDYSLIYGERMIRSLANNTHVDGREFLLEAARIPVQTHVQTFPFDQANEALIALKNDAIRGAAVLLMP